MGERTTMSYQLTNALFGLMEMDFGMTGLLDCWIFGHQTPVFTCHSE
ncbi:hypothetical protein [Flagellimonas sp.]